MAKKQLLVVGQINMDTLVFGTGERRVTPGGGGTYVAMAASTEEAIETNLLATICLDMPASFLEDLHGNGINTENILLLLGEQRRSMLEYSTDFHRNNTGMLTEKWKFLTNEQTPRHLPLRKIHYDALHIPPQPSYNQRLYAKWGHDCGMLVSLDTCERYAQSDGRELLETLQYVDVFMPSEVELYTMFPDCKMDLDQIARQLSDRNLRILVVKCAERGSWVYDYGQQVKYQVGVLPAPVEDATGAGDSYNGGFLTCYLHTGDVARSARYGAAVAAVCIGAVGYEALCGVKERDILRLMSDVFCVETAWGG